MPKDISTELKAHMAQEGSTLAVLWRIRRTDGIVIGITDHQINVTYNRGDGTVIYLTNGGMSQFNFDSKLGAEVDNSQIAAYFDIDALTEEDLYVGLYDDANIDVMVVNYNDLTMGHMEVSSGSMGQVSGQGGAYTSEFRGFAQRAAQIVGVTSSSNCRAEFCDAQCKLDPVTGTDIDGNPITSFGEVTDVDDIFNFTTDITTMPVAFYFRGWVKITNEDSKNAGVIRQVKRYASGQFELIEEFPFPVLVGDTVESRAGCDKLISTCADRWNNVINNDSEWGVPGDSMFLKIPIST